MTCVCKRTQICECYPDCLEAVTCLYRSPEEIEAEYQYYKEISCCHTLMSGPDEPDDIPDAPDWRARR